MAVCSGVQSIQCICGNVYRSMESESHICTEDVIINGFRQTNDIQSFVRQQLGGLMCAVAAQCQKTIQLLILISLFHVLDLVHIVIADDFHHLERLTFGTQNRTAACENAGEIVR